MIAWKKVILAGVVFSVSLAAYAYPLHKKGYSTGSDYLNLLQARNFALSGTYAVESGTGVFLSSDHVVSQGITTGMQNPLTPIIYGFIFKKFGFKPDIAPYLSAVLFAIFNVTIFLLASRLFSVSVGSTAGLASAFMPVMALGASQGAFYEWGMLLFGLALLAYLGSSRGPWSAGIGRTVAASILFSLAALARNAFAISCVAFLLYDWYVHRSAKRSALAALPFLVVFGLTLTPWSWLPVPNGYTSSVNQPFQQVGHFFNDPYSYHYEREATVQEALKHPETLGRVSSRFLALWGYSVPVKEKIKAYADSMSFYIFEAMRLTNVGGPLVVALILLGAIALWKKDRRLVMLFGTWVLLWLGYFIYEQTANWDHYMEVIPVVLFLAALGAQRLWELLGDGRRQAAMMAVVILVLAGHLAYASKWRFHEAYESSRIADAVSFAPALRQLPAGDVYASGVSTEAAYALAYYADRSVIYFHPDTVEKLVRSRKIKEAFDAYGVKAAFGYSPELSEEIKKQTGIPATPRL
jgi:hypothetical protein